MTNLPGAAPGPTISDSPGAVQVVGSSNVHVYVRSGGSEHRLPLAPAVIPLDPSVTSPARILRAGSGVLPFVDRGGLLEKVWDWTTGLDSFAGCVIGGNAGTGKTRLGIEISERARQAGWVTGLLRDKPSDRELESLIELRAKRLVVVDYAELAGELLEGLVPLLAHSAAADAPVRVVLLVRAKPRDSKDWRDPLHGPRRHGLADLLDRMAVWSLNDQPLDTAERRELFRRSAAGLAVRAGQAAASVDSETVDVEPFDDPLSVVIAAYLATHHPSAAVPSTRESLLDALIDNHEHAYWAVTERHPTARADPSMKESVVALASLTTARTRAEAVELLRLLPELHDCGAERRTSLANWAASLYPADGFWGALQPDAIGERLIVRCFAGQPELLGCVIDRDDPVALVRPLQVFARLGLTDGPLRDELGRLVSERLEHLCVLAVKQANEMAHIEELLGTETLAAGINQAAGTLPLRPSNFPTVLNALQVAPSLSLASLHLSLANAFVLLLRGLLERSTSDERVDVFAHALNNQGTVLDRLGHHEDALEAINEAVAIRRALAKERPDAHLPHLAMVLNNQSNALDHLGRVEHALKAVSEAVTIRRTLADADPITHLPALAGTLSNLSTVLERIGEYEGARDASSEAAKHYRKLAESQPEAFLPDLAMTLNNHSNALDRLDRKMGALEAINEAVSIRRTLARSRPDTHLPELATALNNQATVLDRLGRDDEALKAIREAVSLRRFLADAQPNTFLPNLATALYNQATTLGRLKQYDDALEAIDESIAIRRALADARPDTHRPDLASALSNRATLLANKGSLRTAASGAEEAARIGLEALRRSPVAFPDRGHRLLASYAQLSKKAGHKPDRDLVEAFQAFAGEPGA